MRILKPLLNYWTNKTINYAILILVALLGVVIPASYFQLHTWITPLILGVIAAALAEQDESITGRLKAITLTLICFAVATFSIEILFHRPWLFGLGLFASTFGFIMLGSLGPRYATIAFGSILIAIYTMIGAHQSPNLWFQPVLLLSGATWYFCVSFIWAVFFPRHSIQTSLSNVFIQIANYLEMKSELFHPVSNLEPQPYRIKEANLNALTVNALNACKSTLLARSKRGFIHNTSSRFLNIYFIAQDIHERATSSHYRYQDLAEQFKHYDVLFRFKYLMLEQAKSCREIARVIQLGEQYQHMTTSTQALDELQQSLAYLKQLSHPTWQTLLGQLDYLFDNFATIEKQLSNICNPDLQPTMDADEDDHQLSDTTPHTLKHQWLSIKDNLHKDSLLFRHAVRLSLSLTLGYAIIQGLQLQLGYWIMLTTLFVCQPNFSATRQRIVQRIIGTIAGLLIGVLLLTLFPTDESQVALIVFSGVMFFAFRLNNYGYATGFITILVLFCFNQLGAGYAVVLPRLADTLIGCIIAVGAVAFILPDWHARRLHKVMADALNKNKSYLDQVIGQYRIGKKDNLSYRVARRDAHNQDATLTITINNMLAEPEKYKTLTEEAFRFLTLNHALLSYISTLGAHRTRLDEESVHLLIRRSHQVIHRHLDILCQQLSDSHHDKVSELPHTEIEEKLSEWRDHDNRSVSLILQQLHLIYRMLPEFHQLARKFSV